MPRQSKQAKLHKSEMLRLKEWANEQKRNYNPRGAEFSKGMLRIPQLWNDWKAKLEDPVYWEHLADPNFLGIFN